MMEKKIGLTKQAVKDNRCLMIYTSPFPASFAIT